MIRNLLPALLLAFSVFLFSTNSIAQKNNPPQGFEALKKLTVQDSIGLVSLPKLSLPESYKLNPPLLPEIVDNSANMFWRPVFAQIALECGQASSVGMAYTYAVNRERGLPSDIEDNQQATHFTWNWTNGGEGWYGVSYFHTFEILKYVGNPDVNTYGGMTSPSPYSMWMTGYDNYYESMKNRIHEAYQIDVSTSEGIETLKHWLHSHLDNSEVGGVANFYANAPYGMSTLPSGTPEAGKYVVISWGGANHGMTVSGYHDSIRWDYNNDGMYTNHLDINGDGKVNPRDWEIGGLRFANTYSGGPSFGNNGFSYMTYKSLADPSENGGIWNNAVHVQYAKANMDPQLTAKIKLYYDCRKKIRVRMGVSTDLSSENPDFSIAFPILNFQGGCKYMQGGTDEEDKTIEVGLDLTPLLNFVGSETPARYFLMIDEADPENLWSGNIVDYSIIDYTNGINEIVCSQSNVPIIQNGTTTVYVDHTVNFNEVSINEEVLPDATVYEPYSHQFTASGGVEPYYWDFDLNFDETNYEDIFPNISANQLNPGNNGDGYAVQSLDFPFPFYGEEIEEVRVHVDGYIMFEGMHSWPYQVYDFLKFTKNRHISPFMTDLRIYPADGDGMWYEGDSNSATFRWKAAIDGQAATTELNFAVTLFANGDIKFYYGNTGDFGNIEWISGVSDGNNKYYQFTEFSNDAAIPTNYVCDLKSSHKPEEFILDQFGNFEGTPVNNYDELQIKVRATDENNITQSKTVLLSTDGSNYIVVDDYAISAGGDDVVEYGETVSLSISIKSLGEVEISGVEMLLTIDDEYITLIDSTEVLGTFAPNEIIEFENAFTFEVSNYIPDNYELEFNTLISDDEGEEWDSHIYITAHAPEIEAGGITVNDGGNGGLDPGETADIIVQLINNGGAAANNIIAHLTSEDPYLTINDDTGTLPSLGGYGTGGVTFNISVSEDTPAGYIIELNVNLAADNEYEVSDVTYAIVGLINEGFELGNFTAYPWEFSGNADWVIDNTVMYEGVYSASSGDINDDEISEMFMNVCFLATGELSFYRKVSSEGNYDYLRFYVDGIMMGEWDGEQDWNKETYTLQAGVHTLKWAFEKDYSVSNGSDCGWVDYISFPPFGDSDPQMSIDPLVIDKILQGGDIDTDTLTITNLGTGALLFTIAATDTAGNEIDWLSVTPNNGGLNASTAMEIYAEFNTSGLDEGDYLANIIVTDHMENEHIIPVSMFVDIISGIDGNSLISHVQSVPNPFNENTSIQFGLKEKDIVSIVVYDFKGQMIKTLVQDQAFETGNHSINWDATNDSGATIDAGIYFYKITSGTEIMTGKMIYLR
jgi:hypothetical protein